MLFVTAVSRLPMLFISSQFDKVMSQSSLTPNRCDITQKLDELDAKPWRWSLPIQNYEGILCKIDRNNLSVCSICPICIKSLERRTGNPKIEGEIILGEQSDTRHTEITTGHVMCGFRESEAVVLICITNSLIFSCFSSLQVFDTRWFLLHMFSPNFLFI